MKKLFLGLCTALLISCGAPRPLGDIYEDHEFPLPTGEIEAPVYSGDGLTKYEWEAVKLYDQEHHSQLGSFLNFVSKSYENQHDTTHFYNFYLGDVQATKLLHVHGPVYVDNYIVNTKKHHYHGMTLHDWFYIARFLTSPNPNVIGVASYHKLDPTKKQNESYSLYPVYLNHAGQLMTIAVAIDHEQAKIVTAFGTEPNPAFKSVKSKTRTYVYGAGRDVVHAWDSLRQEARKE